ncbi:MAG TPA: metallophosphoesterase [Sumerlaeia bacterium]|nr:metallophosphoesterase [Sumerlaeia bacterium]
MTERPTESSTQEPAVPRGESARAPKSEARGAWFILALQPILFVLANVLFLGRSQRAPSFELIGTVYTFNTVVFPAVLAISGTYGLCRSLRSRRNGPLLRSAAAVLLAALLCVGARVYASHIEPRRLVLKTLRIETGKVDRPVRLLQISDIQSDKIGGHEERVFARIRELQPDIIVHTGDLLQPVRPATLRSELPKIAALLDTLDPPGGVYGVYGDTDEWIHLLRPAIVGSLTMLESQETTVSLNCARVRIFGLSLPQSRRWENSHNAVEAWLSRSRPDDFTVLLGHSPDYILDVEDLPVDLCLAGHTHGGQVRIPFYGPVITLSRLPRSWARGFRVVGQTRLNVSAGIGSEHCAELPNLRINCPPEMTLVEICPSS